MKFRITDKETEADIMGGEVGPENAALTMYMDRGDKDHRKMTIGETMTARFSCSGRSGTYNITRTE